MKPAPPSAVITWIAAGVAFWSVVIWLVLAGWQ